MTTSESSTISLVGNVRSQASRPTSRKLMSSPLVAWMERDPADESTVGVRPAVLPDASFHSLPDAVVTLSVPQPVLSETVAGPSNVPSADATLEGSPRAPQSPANLGATAIALPSTRPGIAAASIPAARPAPVRRRTRPMPSATTASGQTRSASASVAVSSRRRSAATRTPPMASRSTPE
jgi:hypothetical protein